MEVPQKTKNKLPYDNGIAIPLLGIYLEKALIWKDTCIPVFTAALFIISRKWKQPKHPSREKLRCTMEFYSDINKNTEIMPFAATWMDLEVIILSEVS